MFAALHLLRSLVERIRLPRDRDESYLADATDICDLERRMRALDARGREPFSPIAAGLYPR
jgi:hypothetical protein